MVRFKNRWLLVEFISTTASSAPNTKVIEAKHIWNALKQSVLANFGDAGWGAVCSSLTVKYYSPTTQMCIIRVARDHHKIAWAAVTLLSDIEGFQFIPHVVHLSGTIKHAQTAAVEHNRAIVARYRAKAKTAAAYQDSYEQYLETSTKEIESMQD